MALNIETFSNVQGGNAFFKAVGHPLAAGKAAALIENLAAAESVAIYDPLGLVEGFAALHDLSSLKLRHVFVQDLEQIGRGVLGLTAQPVTDLRAADISHLLVIAFDAGRLIDHVRHLVPAGTEVTSLDAMRLDDDMLGEPRNYLHAHNFATNYAFFRDSGGRHTRLVTANYWAGYGAADSELCCVLFDEAGAILAQWRDPLPAGQGTVSIDSAEVRARFGLGEFTGQLFVHALRIKGHDIVKYALDTYGDGNGELSCTHDANAWPADLYAGLPAPAKGEQVVLWVQNSHPCAIPAGAVGLGRMGSDAVVWLDAEIPPFGTRELDVAALLPGLQWPDQIEIHAGKHFVRPRYEVAGSGGRRRIAHANVERTDLRPDPRIAELGNLLGKGYLLPAPILPVKRWDSAALPTPMATCQTDMPVAAILIDASGREVVRHRFGRLARDHDSMIDIGALLADSDGLESGYGHVELVYDLADGGVADGWLHGLFRYADRDSGHGAETSFGAHVFNTVLTYRGEPQSYINRPPGLSTRLFLRLGPGGMDTMCHLIYPASTPWHDCSETDMILFDRGGEEVARQRIEIPCGGSYFWRYGNEMAEDVRMRAGDGAYAIVRDTTCRLFGYHGLLAGDGRFSLDHMFGF